MAATTQVRLLVWSFISLSHDRTLASAMLAACPRNLPQDRRLWTAPNETRAAAVRYSHRCTLSLSLSLSLKRPCGLMDKALVFGTKDCRLESCQGHICHGNFPTPGASAIRVRAGGVGLRGKQAGGGEQVAPFVWGENGTQQWRGTLQIFFGCTGPCCGADPMRPRTSGRMFG